MEWRVAVIRRRSEPVDSGSIERAGPDKGEVEENEVEEEEEAAGDEAGDEDEERGDGTHSSYTVRIIIIIQGHI